MQLLPLTYILDLNDVMFFIKSLHNHHDGFNINDHIKFATGNTRLASSNKLHQTRSTNNTSKHFYFNRLPRIWNTLPIIDLNDHPIRIKSKLSEYLWKHFKVILIQPSCVVFQFHVLVSIVQKFQNHQTLTNCNSYT